MVEAALDEVTDTCALLRMPCSRYKILSMHNEFIFSLCDRLVSPHVIEKLQMMTRWRLPKGTNLRVFEEEFNCNSLASMFL